MALTTFERNQAAHARFMQGRRNFAESNPGALSPQERDRLLGATQAQRDAWAHEKDMLTQQGANDVAVATEKKLGMIGQGSEAATATAAGNVKVAETQGKWGVEAEKQRGANALSAAEKEWAGRKDVAGVEAKGKVDAAEATGKWGVEAEKQRTEAAVRQGELARQQKQQEIDAKTQQAIIASNAKITSAQYRAYAAQDAAVVAQMSAMSKSGEEIAAALQALHKDDALYQEYSKAKAAQEGGANPPPAGGANTPPVAKPTGTSAYRR